MGKITGSATAEIDADIERCFELAADVENAPDWQSGLKDAEVLERDADGRQVVVETHSDAVVKTVRARMRFEYDPPHRISWEQEDGDAKSVVGAWSFEDLGDGRTRATYSLESDPGRMLGMLVRGPVEGQLRRNLVEVRPGELKELAESGR